MSTSQILLGLHTTSVNYLTNKLTMNLDRLPLYISKSILGIIKSTYLPEDLRIFNNSGIKKLLDSLQYTLIKNAVSEHTITK